MEELDQGVREARRGGVWDLGFTSVSMYRNLYKLHARCLLFSPDCCVPIFKNINTYEANKFYEQMTSHTKIN